MRRPAGFLAGTERLSAHGPRTRTRMNPSSFSPIYSPLCEPVALAGCRTNLPPGPTARATGARKPIRRCRATSAAGRSRRRPTGGACPSTPGPARRRTACAASGGSCWRCSRSTGCRCSSSSPATGEPRVTVPFSPYFLEQVKGGDGQLDLLQGRHDPGQVQGQAALPRERQEGDADEAVRDPGAELLERRPAVRAAAGKGREDQRANRRPRASRCWRRSCSASARRC